MGSRVRKVQRTCGFNATTRRCTLKDNGNKNEWCTVGRKSRKCKKSSLGKKLAPKNSKNVLKGKRLIANLRKQGKVKHKIKAKSKHALSNGILYLKGGNLIEELSPFPKAKTYNLGTHFKEDFFTTKKVVHLAL